MTALDHPFLLGAGGSVSAAVEAVWASTRALWAVQGDKQRSSMRPIVSNHGNAFASADRIPVARDVYTKVFEQQILASWLASHPRLDVDRLEAALLAALFPNPDTSEISVRWFSVFHAVRRLLAGVQPEADLHYHAVRGLRGRYSASLSADIAELFHLFADVARRLFESAENGELDLEKQLLPTLYEALPPKTPLPTFVPRLFADLCAALGAITPTRSPGCVKRGPGRLEGETLLNRFFGLPTSIVGFDDLFGGGGLMLADAPQTPQTFGWPNDAHPIGARMVLAMGSFGSGKSLLSLQIAVEVARKGGIAWLLAFEQTPQECRYALESIGISVRSPYFTFIADPVDAFSLPARPSGGQGALVFLPGKREHYAGFLEQLENKLDLLQEYPLRLLIIDPFNAVYPVNDNDSTTSRASTVALLQKAKRASVNVWMTSEQTGDTESLERFEENIADTVIRLGVKRDFAPQRYIEVTKSRWQRERPGPRVLTITSSSGLHVHASSSDFLDTPPTRRHFEAPRAISTGIEGLETILGPRAILSGEIISLHGVLGASKILIGLQFLRAARQDSPSGRALLVSDFSERRMNELIGTPRAPAARREIAAGGEDILRLSIAPNVGDPGQILLSIRNVLEAHDQADDPIERVVISNLSRWELEMPRLGQDPAFGIGLLSLLRAYRPTCVIISGFASTQRRSPLTQLLLEDSDCALELSRIEFRGEDKYFLRALKTHGSTHRRGRFELFVRNGVLQVMTKEALIRVDPSGAVHPAPIRLFLHSETLNHKRYNDHILASLRTTLSTETDIDTQNRQYDPYILRLGPSSGIDETQILQLDEFQLMQDAESCPLFQFDGGSEIHDFLHDRLPDSSRRCIRKKSDGSQSLIAVPFYENISLLSYRLTPFQMLKRAESGRWTIGSWAELIDAYDAWCKQPHKEDDLFFVCQVAQSDWFESYNCLFLEILYSLQDLPTGADCDLFSWLTMTPELTKKALRYFRTLVLPCHKRMFRAGWQTGDEAEWRNREAEMTSRAAVVRHWYNTLNQTLADASADAISDVRISPLFGRKPGTFISTSGGWYLAVPAYSAAPRVALDVIAYLTTAGEEVQRLHRGIGLPVRAAFYDVAPGKDDENASVSPYFDINRKLLHDLVHDAFRRSRFHCYETFSETLSSHLQRLLDMQLTSASVDVIFESLHSTMVFIRKRSSCETCSTRHRSAEQNIVSL